MTPEARRRRARMASRPSLLEPGDCPAASELYDRYGARLYALAMMVTTRPCEAESAVVDGFRAAATSATSANDQGDAPLQVLAGAIFAACPPVEGRQAQWARLLALTLYGAYTYREAAATLGIEPEDAARYLRIALHESSRASRMAADPDDVHEGDNGDGRGRR